MRDTIAIVASLSSFLINSLFCSATMWNDNCVVRPLIILHSSVCFVCCVLCVVGDTHCPHKQSTQSRYTRSIHLMHEEIYLVRRTIKFRSWSECTMRCGKRYNEEKCKANGNLHKGSQIEIVAHFNWGLWTILSFGGQKANVARRLKQRRRWTE